MTPLLRSMGVILLSFSGRFWSSWYKENTNETENLFMLFWFGVNRMGKRPGHITSKYTESGNVSEIKTKFQITMAEKQRTRQKLINDCIHRYFYPSIHIHVEKLNLNVIYSGMQSFELHPIQEIFKK